MAMTPQELRGIIRYIYGSERGVQRELAADIGVKEVTVSRWVTGYSPIGTTEERFIRLLEVLHRKKITYRQLLKEEEVNAAGRNALEDLI